jgi:hypothetical protein
MMPMSDHDSGANLLAFCLGVPEEFFQDFWCSLVHTLASVLHVCGTANRICYFELQVQGKVVGQVKLASLFSKRGIIKAWSAICNQFGWLAWPLSHSVPERKAENGICGAKVCLLRSLRAALEMSEKFFHSHIAVGVGSTEPNVVTTGVRNQHPLQVD